jgi:hypothetical protein
MVLLAAVEGVVALVATVESQGLEGIREGMDLVATMAGLVFEQEIVEEEMVSLVMPTAWEVVLVSEAV